MANTFVKLSSVTVGAGGSATISFNSIPSTYTDLCLRLSARSSAATQTATVQFNGVTTNYAVLYIYADGTTSGSGAGSAAYYGFVNSSTSAASLFAATDIYIPNYNSSNYKAVSSDVGIESNTTAYIAELAAGLWSNTSAITSITLTPLSGNFVQYTTATLYGILKA